MRWLLLILSTVVWLFCMRMIYLNFRPPEAPKDALPGTQAALDALFDENADLRRKWRLFIDLDKLVASGQSPADAARRPPWDGVDEHTLQEIGWLEARLVRRHVTRVEQVSEAVLDLPKELKAPWALLLGHMHYESRANISQDQGIEDFKSEFTTGILRATTFGIRDGDSFNLTQQVFQGNRQILSQPMRLPVGPKAAPTLELLPFLDNREIKKDYSWPLVTLDSGSLVSGTDGSARLKVMQATCTGTRQIVYAGKTMQAFEARTEDGRGRAWYSADGIVLKQAYNIAGILDIMVVRVDLTHAALPGAGDGGAK